ncbi:MAG: HAMP domain-containing sensor histidine kinase [Candidatus Sericytochromatia bacterium]
MEKKTGTFILNEDKEIVFYDGNLNEVSGLSFDPNNIVNKPIYGVLSEDVIIKVLSGELSGTFSHKKDQYIYKRNHFSLDGINPLTYLNLEIESDHNISFYSMLIHEIKNPLAAVRTLVQSLSTIIAEDLENTSSGDMAKDYFKRIISEIDRLNRLLLSVKYISKHVQSLYIPFDIVTVAENTIKIFENTFKEKEIELICNFNVKSIPFYGDPDQFQQIFNNLLTNAIEALSSSKGKIYFNLEQDKDGNIKIEIIDEGMGIENKDLGQIFKAFYSKKIGGMGIGLSVVNMIVKRYKGKLLIDSKVGKGTKMAITFPPNKLSDYLA